MINKINKAVTIGLSIMDNYIDIDGDNVNGFDGNDGNYDDEDVYGDNDGEVHIYEAKDPYILRNLPYLIGPAQYLENDDIGNYLKDLDADDEEEEEEVEEEKDDEDEDVDEKEDNDNKAATSQSRKANEKDDEDDDEDDGDLFATNKSKETVKPKDEDDDEDEDGGFNLFKSLSSKPYVCILS